MQLDRLTLGRIAKELGFVRDTIHDFTGKCTDDDIGNLHRTEYWGEQA